MYLLYPPPEGGGYGVICYGNIIKEAPSFFKAKNKTAQWAVLEHLVRGAPAAGRTVQTEAPRYEEQAVPERSGLLFLTRTVYHTFWKKDMFIL